MAVLTLGIARLDLAMVRSIVRPATFQFSFLCPGAVSKKALFSGVKPIASVRQPGGRRDSRYGANQRGRLAFPGTRLRSQSGDWRSQDQLRSQSGDWRSQGPGYGANREIGVPRDQAAEPIGRLAFPGTKLRSQSGDWRSQGPATEPIRRLAFPGTRLRSQSGDWRSQGPGYGANREIGVPRDQAAEPIGRLTFPGARLRSQSGDWRSQGPGYGANREIGVPG